MWIKKLDDSSNTGLCIHRDDADQEAREEKPLESPNLPLYKLLLKQNEKFVGSQRKREPRSNLVSVEETLRMEIDGMLEDNLEFWLRFSTSIHMVQKFQATIHDLQVEVLKLMEKHRQEDPSGEDSHHRHFSQSLTSDVRPIYKHLKEIQTELRMWLEHHSVLKEEEQEKRGWGSKEEDFRGAMKRKPRSLWAGKGSSISIDGDGVGFPSP